MAFNEAILADERPNFFELLAEEQLRDSLRPALLYLAKVLARARPGGFSAALWRSRDEAHLALDSALQWGFLALHESSLSEHFYSLKRVGVGGNGGLGARECCVSLVGLVLIPYLKVKLERLHSMLTDEDDSVGLSWQRGESLKKLLKFLLFKLTPYFQSLWALSHFMFQLCYLIKRSPHYSPLHWLAGVRLVRNPDTVGSLGRVWPWLCGQLLSLSLLSLRLLQWWFSGENEPAVRKMTSLPAPPPPISSQPSPGGVCLPTDPLLCPLCQQSRQDPTVLATSGFVFCYDCISRHVASHGVCPLTLYPTSPQQLIKLFLSPPHSN